MRFTSRLMKYSGPSWPSGLVLLKLKLPIAGHFCAFFSQLPIYIDKLIKLLNLFEKKIVISVASGDIKFQGFSNFVQCCFINYL